jgi:hypothetical protein
MSSSIIERMLGLPQDVRAERNAPCRDVPTGSRG